MKTDKFVLSGGNSHALEMAMNRPENGEWTSDLIHKMTLGNNLGLFREVLLGCAEVKILKYVVDFDKLPLIPDGWTILPDNEQLLRRVKGFMEFNPAKIALYLDLDQKNSKVIEGNKLRKKLGNVPVYGAQLLEFYLANPHFIPVKWKDKAIFFWGTIYCHANSGSCVRYLYWHGGRWCWDYNWLDVVWHDYSPAAVSAS
ncbi:MAG: hypothetical protein AAB484_01200 [Patescibacteria group bacterium]